MQNKTKEKLNFAFWGTPDVASETLEILKRAGFLPSLIVTSPDKPQGRKMLLTPSPVKVWAEQNGIPYIQPEKPKKEEIDVALRALSQTNEQSNIDIFVVVAYGKILPEDIINMPRLGSINIHYSLLPKYRGASPVESAILNGEIETGVTIQQMEFKLDAGDILAQKKVKILPEEKASELRARLIKVGGELLVKTLPDLREGKIKPVKQDESEATHCSKIKKEDGLIDIEGDAIKNYNKFRAYNVWPRIFFFKDGKRIIITKAKLENGNFIIEKIIPEGGKEVDYKIT